MDKIALQTVNCIYFLADVAIEQSGNNSESAEKGLIPAPAVENSSPALPSSAIFKWGVYNSGNIFIHPGSIIALSLWI